MTARVTRGRLAAVVVVVLAVGALTAACDGPDDGTLPKAGDGTERHDAGPLVDRIPALEGLTDATWFSGTLGSRDAPGPSTYWIDAVVTLPPADADELRSTLDLATATAVPDVVDDLAPALPEGDLLAGDELDAAYSQDGWQATAYLSATGDQLVLLVVGE